MGDRIEPREAIKLPPGGFATMPARMHHYAMCASTGPCVVQVHGAGPFDIHHVNAEGDPTKVVTR
jgi:hypothetical protein